MILDTLSWLALALGSLALVIGAVGLIRFPDLFSRLHAAGVIDTLAVMLILFGLLLQSGFSLISVKLLIILFFLLFTTPVSAHALAKTALYGKISPLLAETGDKPANRPD